MTQSLAVMLVLMVAALGCHSAVAPPLTLPATAQATDNALTVMTFNLRFASVKPPNAWGQRREAMKECIQSVDPDLFGTQEGLYGQLKDMETDLRDYAWIGLGRDGGSKGGFMASFFRQGPFGPPADDHLLICGNPGELSTNTRGETDRSKTA